MNSSWKEFCDMQRKKIQLKLETFEEELTLYKEDISSEQIMIINMMSHKIKILKQSLFRIDKGDYGVCKYCGEGISRIRLSVAPETETCLNCAKKIK